MSAHNPATRLTGDQVTGRPSTEVRYALARALEVLDPAQREDARKRLGRAMTVRY